MMAVCGENLIGIRDRALIADLAEVAKGSGPPQGVKNTVLMYLLARQMLVKDLFISEQDCAQFPDLPSAPACQTH